MGGVFSTGKRPAPVEAESAASHPALRDTNTVTNPTEPAQPPLKRRRIDPHNDPIISLCIPPSVPTKTQEDIVPLPSSSVTEPPPQKSKIEATLTHRHGNKEVVKPNRPKRYKKKRFALFMGFNGENYHGMQINPGVITIEKLLMEALYKARLISDSNRGHYGKVGLMRAARTDKGVSAAGQCVSAKFEMIETMGEHFDDDVLPSWPPSKPSDNDNNEEEIDPVREINRHLPHDVKVYGLFRVTPSFNARQDCQKRRYEYIFPLRLLGGLNTLLSDTKDNTDSRIEKLSLILQKYEGSHCFANFTEGLKSDNDAARRYMLSVRCAEPFKPPGCLDWYVCIEVVGQSFLLHQIRKMVGLAVAVYHGHCPQEAIPVALCADVKFPTPKAPADGLLLDTLYFDQYNRRSRVKMGVEIGDEAFGKLKHDFKMQKIYKRIAERESQSLVLETWIETCDSRVSDKKYNVLDLFKKYVTTDIGRREQREAYAKSLYHIRTDIHEFLEVPRNEEEKDEKDGDNAVMTDEENDKHLLRKCTEVRKAFEKRFGVKATFMVRAPGRAILIGEHLDYNGFPVIATAMRQCTLIAGCLDDDSASVDIAHIEDEKYRCGRMDANGKLQEQIEDERDANWLKYVSGGSNAFATFLKFRRTVKGGGKLLFSGDVPRASGLASSSSLITGSSLAASRLSRKRVPREALVGIAAEGERGTIGTKGGCVDHATIVCAEKGMIVKVDFAPKLKVENIKWFTNGVRIYVIGSGIDADKGNNKFVKRLFNWRSAECKVGAAVAAKRLKVHLPNAVTSAGQLLHNARKTNGIIEMRKQKNISEKNKEQNKGNDDDDDDDADDADDDDRLSVKELRDMLFGVIGENESLNVEGARKELDVVEAEMRNRFIGSGVTWDDNDVLEIGKRMRHVFSEVVRVEEFTRILKDDKLSISKKLERLGRILNEGHESLKKWYESSVTEVDELVEFCKDSGAAGSRMTGAGWGGFIVNLVAEDRAREFASRMVNRVGKHNVIEVKPWGGASLLAIHENPAAPRNRVADEGPRHQPTSKTDPRSQ